MLCKIRTQYRAMIIRRSLTASVMFLSVDQWEQKPNEYRREVSEIEMGDMLNYMSACPEVYKVPRLS